MQDTAERSLSIHYYQSHDLTVKSRFPLPFAEVKTIGHGTTDVDITYDCGRHQDFDASTTRQRMTYTDGIAFEIQDGRRIRVIAPSHVSPERLSALIMTGPWKALLLQREVIPFRGSAVNYGNHSMAIIGRRSAGASTLALMLINKGAQLISDGIFTIKHDPLDTLHIPSGQIRLDAWQDTINAFTCERTAMQLRTNIPRYGIPETPPAQTNMPLRKLLLIAPGRGQSPALKRLAPNEALEKLLSITERHIMLRHPCLRPNLLRNAAAMINAASVFEIFGHKNLINQETSQTSPLLDQILEGMA